jgi:integrase
MARRVRDTKFDSRTARDKLKPSGKPYYVAIGKGLHLGYRKNRVGGVWVVRRYAGNQTYLTDTIGASDDIADADGTTVLDFWQAQEKAREMGGKMVYAGPYRVKDAFEAYLTYLGSRKEVSSRYRDHIAPLADDLVDALTAERLRAWHNNLVRVSDDPEVIRKSQCSANRVWTVLRAALNFAFTEKKVASDAEWRRVKPFKDVDKAKIRFLTMAECDRFLNACEPDFRLLARAGLETGCRYGELARLVCGDYNPDSGTLHIQKSKTGKGRHLVLTEQGQEFFVGLVAGRPKSAPMFGREWGHDDQTHPMKRAVKAARLDEPISFHGLRHSWASHAVMGGMPLIVVARHLGHVNTNMVQRHYGHLAPDYVVDQVRQFSPRFGKVETNVTAIR